MIELKMLENYFGNMNRIQLERVKEKLSGLDEIKRKSVMKLILSMEVNQPTSVTVQKYIDLLPCSDSHEVIRVYQEVLQQNGNNLNVSLESVRMINPIAFRIIFQIGYNKLALIGEKKAYQLISDEFQALDEKANHEYYSLLQKARDIHV